MAARLDTNFKSDIVEFGSVGEQWFYDKLSTSKKTNRVIVTADNKDYIKYDVDLIQIVTDIDETEILNTYQNGRYLNESVAVAYEVKTDTQIGKTRNIAFEMMSHTSVGCAIRTLANYLVYTGYDNETKTINEAYLINTYKIKSWILNNWSDINKAPYIRSFFMNHKNDKTAILLIKIDKLIEENIAIKIL